MKNWWPKLSFLKEQINPHFLFNTLNNLYYLAYTKSDNTTEVIAKLSQMMRYMIYESNHPQVELSKEIEYMQNYVSLERLRLTNDVPIKFDVQGDLGGSRVSPLILITFLENAFKHGVASNNKNAWVDLSLKIDGNKLRLHCCQQQDKRRTFGTQWQVRHRVAECEAPP